MTQGGNREVRALAALQHQGLSTHLYEECAHKHRILGVASEEVTVYTLAFVWVTTLPYQLLMLSSCTRKCSSFEEV